MKPWLLDLFCGAGGCTKGYQSAGFYVVGVDVKPQPRYCGDEFVQADALTYLATTDLAEFVVIHASPPCAYLIPSLALGPPSAPPTTLGAPRSASSGTPRTSPSRMNAWRSRLLKVPWRDFPCLELGALSGYPTTGGTMSTVVICADCGRPIEHYEDDGPYVEVESGRCIRCSDRMSAFDRGFAEYEPERACPAAHDSEEDSR